MYCTIYFQLINKKFNKEDKFYLIMKIYFGGSIRGGRDDAELYNQIIEYLNTQGEVLTEHIGDKNLSSSGENSKKQYIHDRDLKWITECDIMVAEVSLPSLGVGYEIREALNKNKKILCLYRPQENKKLSAMILGSSKITNKTYTNLAKAKQAIDEFLKTA